MLLINYFSQAILHDQPCCLSSVGVGGRIGRIPDGRYIHRLFSCFSKRESFVSHPQTKTLLQIGRVCPVNGSSRICPIGVRVIVNSKTSKWTTVLSGVSEGSLLAPLLFSLFINDLPREVDSGCLLYADDVKIFRKNRLTI